MDATFPGSVLPRQGRTAKEFLSGLFFATKGLMLLQVKEITGLDTPTIQNWIGRGWAPRPVEKRYSVNHLARIMIINMLRPVAKLEHIDKILTYINGSSEEESEDAIPEATLYIYVCDILDKVDFETLLTRDALDAVIKNQIDDYKAPNDAAREKLICCIKIILIYYASAVIKVRADRMLCTLGIADEESAV